MVQRLQISLTPRTAESLQAAAKELDTTQSGVVSDGVRLVRRALEAAFAGGQIGIVGPDGRLVSVISGPWDDLKPRKVG